MTGKVREETVVIVLYKCSSHSTCVTTLGCCCGLTVSTEVPQHHDIGRCVDTEAFSSNLVRMGSIVNACQWEATAQ